MTAFHFLANTAESHSHSLSDALPHMAGMAMVMVALGFLWGVCAFTARVISILLPEKSPTKPVTTPMATPDSAPQQVAAAPDGSRIPPEIVAVIAAAVSTVLRDQPVRIVSIKPMSTAWERAGRQSVLTSHRIR